MATDALLLVCCQVVELRRCEREQVKALRLIFKLIQRDVELLREFVQCDGYSMIVKVCMTNRCIVGHDLIKVTQTCLVM